jgi:hypothetical protein
MPMPDLAAATLALLALAGGGLFLAAGGAAQQAMLPLGPPGIWLRLVLDPLSATIFSSDPDTYAAIQALEARGMPLADAIRKVAGLSQGER